LILHIFFIINLNQTHSRLTASYNISAAVNGLAVTGR